MIPSAFALVLKLEIVVLMMLRILVKSVVELLRKYLGSTREQVEIVEIPNFVV